MDRHYNKRSMQIQRNQAPAGERLKPLRRRLILILMFFLFIWSFLAFVRSDFFSLREIEIGGQMHITDEEILLALAVDPGTNIWRLSPSLLRRRVEALVRIQTAEVHRRLPKALVVTVTEKEPVVLAPFGEFLLEVCRDGQIIGITQDPQYYGLPLITGITPLQTEIGGYVLQGSQLKNLLDALSAVEGYGLAASEFNMADPENLVLVTLDGLVVWLGDSEFVEKADLLAQICSQFKERKAQGYLDLRVKDAPVFSGSDSFPPKK